MNRYSMSVCGIHTIQEIQRINFEQVFMGVTGYCEQTGFTCGVDEEAVLKRTVMDRAGQKIILMDSSKTEVKSTYSICGLEDVDLIISDGGLSEEFQKECRNYKIPVI